MDGPLFNPYSFWGIVWVHLGTGGLAQRDVVDTGVPPPGRHLEEAARVAGANTDHGAAAHHLTGAVADDHRDRGVELHQGLESFNTELLLGLPAGIYVYGTRIYDYIRQEPPAYGGHRARLGVPAGAGRAGGALSPLFSGQQEVRRGDRQGYSTARIKLGGWRYVALGGFILWYLVMMVLPLTFLVMGSFMRRYGFFEIASPFTLAHWRGLFGDPLFLGSLHNSLAIASITAVLSVLVYSIVGYLLASRHLMFPALLEFLCWLPWVIPGILMSLGLLWVFLASPLRGILYGTVWASLALTIHHSPVSTQAFKSAFLQLGRI